MDAARHWARRERGERRRPATVDDDAARDFAALGVKPEDIALMRESALEEPEEPEAFAVWRENWDALELFLSVQTQWRVVAVAGLVGGGVFYQGLDYPALRAAHEMRGGTWSAALFEDIAAMEGAALPELNRRAS